MTEIKLEVEKVLSEIVAKLTGEEAQVELSIPSDLSKGDYATNISMRLGKKLGSPMEAGEAIIEEFRANGGLYKEFEKIELVKPGFINFWLSRGYISTKLNGVLSSKNKVAPATKSLIFEFGDPNPFKEPHIGHVRNLVLGEAISRLFEAQGWEVVRADYQGDVGMHVAKAIWGITKLGFDTVKDSSLEIQTAFLGKAYSTGAKAYEDDEKAKSEIVEINKKVYEKDPEILKLWEKGRKISLDHFENLYSRLGVKYKKYYFESETAPIGLKIVKENIGKVFEENDGATIFRGEEYGLHTRVFITGEGYPTYEAKDLALSILKDKDYPEVGKSIIMTANEQVEYFKVMLAALKLIDAKTASKTSHLSFGFVNLKDGKMSSRSGNVVTAFWLLDEVSERLKKGFKEVSDEVLEALTVGAVKWSMLKFSRESNISFNIDESVQIEGNSGPYMQYAYARTQSLLQKSGKGLSEASLHENFEPELLALARFVCQFESVLETASKTFSPNILANYLYDLAKAFSSFYEKEKIIGGQEEEQKLLIVKTVGSVLKDGLNLLGISAPEKI